MPCRNLFFPRWVHGWPAALIVGCLYYLHSSPGAAAVAIISNRTTEEIKFSVVSAGGETERAHSTAQPAQYKLASGELIPVPLARGVGAKLVSNGIDCPIQADAAYYFAELPSGKIDLDQIGIGDMPQADPRADLPILRPNQSPEAEEAARTITVKIFVDEKEPSKPEVWQRRLRDRVAAASDILERTCGMRLKVIAAGTWDSDSNITKFEEAVDEFNRKADPDEARVAIGFTSQFQITRGRTHLGGTQGPLNRHILLREWSQYVTEPERLELLVHELGHFLGAVHSPEPDSVMRPILGDKQARARKFQIHFDPLNALAMNLVAEQWQQHPPLHSYGELSPQTQARLSVIYSAIAEALPTDPAAAQYLRILGRTVGPPITIGSQ
ncbi:MAG TPA: M12 family metallo-peptidase [Pirellulales bacterium]|nr:M12 family metallo-peptidase [Pirellulales bacterium]